MSANWEYLCILVFAFFSYSISAQNQASHSFENLKVGDKLSFEKSCEHNCSIPIPDSLFSLLMQEVFWDNGGELLPDQPLFDLQNRRPANKNTVMDSKNFKAYIKFPSKGKVGIFQCNFVYNNNTMYKKIYRSQASDNQNSLVTDLPDYKAILQIDFLGWLLIK